MPPYRALVTRSGEDRGKPYFLKNASRLQPGTGKGPQRHCQPKQLRNNPRGCFNAPKFPLTPDHTPVIPGPDPPSPTPIPRHPRPHRPESSGSAAWARLRSGRSRPQQHHITAIPHGKMPLDPPNRLSGAGRNQGGWVGSPSVPHEVEDRRHHVTVIPGKCRNPPTHPPSPSRHYHAQRGTIPVTQNCNPDWRAANLPRHTSRRTRGSNDCPVQTASEQTA